jgi:receptor protein-tyrosine kinase
LDFRRFLGVVRRSILLIIGGALLAGAAGYAMSNVLPPVYESEAVVLVGSDLSSTDADTGEMDASRRLSETYARVATTRPVLQRVLDESGLEMTTDDLAERVAVTTIQEPSVITITAEMGDPRLAADVVNLIVAELLEITPNSTDVGADDFVARQLAVVEGEIAAILGELEALADVTTPTPAQVQRRDDLQLRLAELQGTYAILRNSTRPANNTLTILEEGVPNPDAISPRPLQNAVIAGFLGLLLALIAAILRDHLDDRVRSADDVEEATGFPVVGTVGRMPRSIRPKTGQSIAASISPIAHSFRSLRMVLEVAAGDPLPSVLVTSAMHGEGKTTVAVNLAVAYARAGREVLLVDGDSRRATLHQYLGVENRRGIRELLWSPLSQRPIDLVTSTDIEGLRVLTGGNPHAKSPESVGSAHIRALMERLRDTAELVIVDGGSVFDDAWLPLFAAHAAGTILVVDAGRHRRGSLEMSRDALMRGGATVVGTVLNRVPESGPVSDLRAIRERSG